MAYYKVEECCEILDFKRVPVTAKDRISGPYPYYGANGVQDYVNEFIFDDELVLVAEDGGNFGSKTRPIAYRVSGKCWVNNHAHVLKAKEFIDVDYLCYSLMFYNVGSMVNGATRQKLNQNQLRQMLVPKRTLEEQKEIVSQLNSLATIKENRIKQIELYDDLIKSRFVEMFGDVTSNTKNWKTDVLSNHLNVIGGYAFKSEAFADEGIPVLKIGNINAGYFRPTNLAFWVKDENLKRYEIVKGDLVISLTGTVGKDDYGNVCVMGDDYPLYYLNQRNAKLDLFETIDKHYIMYTLKVPDIKNRLTGISRGVRQANISNRDILSLDIPIPPIQNQIVFAEFVEQVDKLKLEVQKSLEQTQILFDSLMQEYFE